MSEKRRDNKGRILKTGEHQEKDGRYSYRYIDSMGKRRIIRSWRLTNADITPPGKKVTPSLREQEQELQVQISKGIFPTGITVCELVERYITTKTGVTHNTKAGYKTVQNILEKEEFGHKQIDKVKFSDAKIFLIRLQENGRSYSTIHCIRGVLRPAFQMAFEDEEIGYNPFNFELAKVLINDSVQREALTPREQRLFIDFVKRDKHFSKYYDGISILFKTGLRISEFCGLTVHDINFEDHTFSVNNQLQRTREGKYIIVPTKTNAGKRVLPMTKEVEEHFRKIIEEREKPRIEPMIDGKSGFLYLDKNGNPSLALHWAHYFKHICQKYNSIYKVQMPTVTPHVCRHTYCSNMARSGISAKTLQYLMGHSDISVTLNVYTHLGLEDAQHELKELEKRVNSHTSKVVNF
ncbi:MAG: site-specific integrase [Clostridiales bacterium 36_14]|nr:MAG: site-specific integrase [Clostridiales bacterium 36_14]